jgi:3-hydroxyisobutyrate dehydrogenase-like beta-hydroxyacid dehydrogenase
MTHTTGNAFTIGFVGFGEAARAFRQSLAAADPALAFIAYDIKLHNAGDAEMRAAMHDHQVVVAETIEGLSPANWIFSAVTADQSLVAVEPLLPFLRQGQLLIDINSVSPARKQLTNKRVAATGAKYADMAVMTPVHPKGHASPVLLAGEPVEAMSGELDRLGFDFEVSGDSPGAATAIKMVRSLFVKGLEAITVETLLAAEASGCRDQILATLTAGYPGLGWPGIVDYHLERTLTHGLRRAAEMDECAATLNDLGLRGELATAIAVVQRDQGEVGLAGTRFDNLNETLPRNLSDRLDASSGKGRHDKQDKPPG